MTAEMPHPRLPYRISKGKHGSLSEIRRLSLLTPLTSSHGRGHPGGVWWLACAWPGSSPRARCLPGRAAWALPLAVFALALALRALEYVVGAIGFGLTLPWRGPRARSRMPLVERQGHRCAYLIFQ